ncbi:MAG TPA: amidohydrolase family protein [Candidatus Acidoferrales bacterium]|jgi:N-acyl-D-aspartate/D-glutamate deacylase|nr:amidohydrolase family protein [Candidatus Acidoferrales bacterium]
MRFLLWIVPSLLAAQAYDVVLQRGRVLDPESGLDAVRSVGINGKRIVAISSRPLRGKIEVDAAGLVVAPGFIDLHSHGQTPENYRYKAMDGVTTALELEVGVSPVSEWYVAREGKALVNFGASAGHIPARMAVMKDTGDFLPRDAAMNRRATLEEQKAIAAAVRKGLDEGALGMGLGLAYTPTATHEEILDLFYLAATWKRPVFVHMRDAGSAVPGIFEGLQEVIGDAAASGAALHIVHINSMAQKKTPEALRMIEGVRARGLDVTTEAYPYIAGASRLESALFEPGWQEKLGGSYSELLWVATGERLTAESFERYRKQGGRVVIFMNTEEMVRIAIANPLVMIASDGGLANGQGHPRSAGTYARVLGKYVREEKALSLMDAIRKSSLMPAQRLESMSPQMRQKGRLRVGADADISVFDPLRVIDKATFENPAQYSEGFRHVMVEGTFVVRDGKLQEGVAPGQAVRAR